jgi:hypothetical protein
MCGGIIICFGEAGSFVEDVELGGEGEGAWGFAVVEGLWRGEG